MFVLRSLLPLANLSYRVLDRADLIVLRAHIRFPMCMPWLTSVRSLVAAPLKRMGVTPIDAGPVLLVLA